MVSKLEEEIISGGQKFRLAANLINDISLKARQENILAVNKAKFCRQKEANLTRDIFYQAEYLV